MAATLVLRGAAVLDAEGSFDGPLDVVVEGAVIRAVGRAPRAPRDRLDLDCRGLFVLPGFFDCHSHVAVSTFDELELLHTPLSLRTLEAARNLRRTLEAGVTFVRDAGGADAGVRDALERELVPGPRLQVSVVPLTQTGGHFDGFLAGPGLELSTGLMLPEYPGRPPFLVDGVDAVRRAVRTILRAGADWIKVCTTGGVFSGLEAATRPQLSLDEVATAVDEAARAGKPVMAHAVGGEGIDIALAAGVRSIEHGVLLTEAQAAEMARRGAFLVPTLAIYARVAGMADEGLLPPTAADAARALRERLGEAVRVAAAHGVPIAAGSDFAARTQHGANLEEIALLHEAGLPIAAALRSATVVGADLCGVANHLGRIAPGFAFDAVLLDEEPRDGACFKRPDVVTGVFRAGQAVVEHERFRN